MVNLFKTITIYLCLIGMIILTTSCAFHQAEQWVEDEEEKAFIERRVRTEEEIEYMEKVKENSDNSIIFFDIDYQDENNRK